MKTALEGRGLFRHGLAPTNASRIKGLSHQLFDYRRIEFHTTKVDRACASGPSSRMRDGGQGQNRTTDTRISSHKLVSATSTASTGQPGRPSRRVPHGAGPCGTDSSKTPAKSPAISPNILGAQVQIGGRRCSTRTRVLTVAAVPRQPRLAPNKWAGYPIADPTGQLRD